MTSTTTTHTDAKLYARDIAHDIERIVCADDIDALDAWFDDVLDTEYVVDSAKRYLGAHLYVTLGGPTAYVDTREGCVVVHWGDDHSATWGLSERASDALAEYASDMYDIA